MQLPRFGKDPGGPLLAEIVQPFRETQTMEASSEGLGFRV